MGKTLAAFHKLGKIPSSKLLLIMFASGTEIIEATDFSKFPLIPSIPVALFTTIFLSWLSRSEQVIRGTEKVGFFGTFLSMLSRNTSLGTYSVLLDQFLLDITFVTNSGVVPNPLGCRTLYLNGTGRSGGGVRGPFI